MKQAFDKIVQPYYYVVVQFLAKPYSVLDEYVCVPYFWIKPTRSKDQIVAVAYPDEEPIITTYLAKTGEAPQHHWKLYQAIVKNFWYSYSDAMVWITRHHATVKNRSSNEKDYPLGLPFLTGYFPSSLNTNKLQAVSGSSEASQKPMLRGSLSPVLRNEPESIASGANIHDIRSQTAKAVEPKKTDLSVHRHKNNKPRVDEIAERLSAAVQSSSNLTNNPSQQHKRSMQKKVSKVTQSSPQVESRSVYLDNLNREKHARETVAERPNSVPINMVIPAPTFQNPSNIANLSSPHQSAESLSAYQKPIDMRTESKNIANRLVAAGQSSSLKRNFPHQPEHSVQKQVASVIKNSPQAVLRTPEKRRLSPENIVRERVPDIQEKVAKISNDVQINMDTTTPTIQKPANEANQSSSHQLAELLSTSPSLSVYNKPIANRTDPKNIEKKLVAAGQSSSLTRNSPHQPEHSVQKQVSSVIQNSPQAVLRTPEKKILSPENIVRDIEEVQSAESLSAYQKPVDMRTESKNIENRLVAAGQISSLTRNSPHQPEHSVQKQVAPVIQNSPQAVLRTPEKRRLSPENIVRERVPDIQEKVAKISNDVQSNMDTTTPTIQKPANEANQSSSQQLAELLIRTRPTLSVFIKPANKGTLLENNASTATRNPSNLTEKFSQKPNSSVKVPAPVIQNTSQVPRKREKQVGKSGGAIGKKVRLQDNTKNAKANTQAILNKTSTQKNYINQATAAQSLTEEKRSRDALTLPPKYNLKNSKCTLKYRKRARGLEELLQDSGIYVNAIDLAHCKRSSNNCNQLARNLLNAVFSDKALTECSLKGPRGKVHDGSKTRPRLDEFAIKTIFKFVEDYSSENNWDKFNYKSVLQSMHDGMKNAKKPNKN